MRISDWSSDVCSSDLVCRSTRWRSELKWFEIEAWTEANFCSDFICRNRSIARSRRRNGRCEFSARLFSQRRSEEHTSELQSLMRISYAVFCLKKKKHKHLSLK